MNQFTKFYSILVIAFLVPNFIGATPLKCKLGYVPGEMQSSRIIYTTDRLTSDIGYVMKHFEKIEGDGKINIIESDSYENSKERHDISFELNSYNGTWSNPSRLFARLQPQRSGLAKPIDLQFQISNDQSGNKQIDIELARPRKDEEKVFWPDQIEKITVPELSKITYRPKDGEVARTVSGVEATRARMKALSWLDVYTHRASAHLSAKSGSSITLSMSGSEGVKEYNITCWIE
jgi:hypothetical protein